MILGVRWLDTVLFFLLFRFCNNFGLKPKTKKLKRSRATALQMAHFLGITRGRRRYFHDESGAFGPAGR
jgi:hypothetical protein